MKKLKGNEWHWWYTLLLVANAIYIILFYIMMKAY